ncbi:unnamed protein product [Heterobilharzia americana]|nr:unnamed protein product [Heterobilharzia americana]
MHPYKDVICYNIRPRITSGPIIVGANKNALVSGTEAYLQCLASGQPQPTIHWYHERDLQTELQKINPNRFSVNTNCRAGLLRISEVSYPEDSGIYKCRAVIPVPAIYSGSTSISTTEAQIHISVALPPILIPLTTMNSYVELGGTARVQCRVRATTPMEFYFKRLNSNASYINGVQPDDKRIRVWREEDVSDPLNHDLFLTIENATLDDTWNYSCHAGNEGNSSHSEKSGLRFGWRFNATNLTCISRGMPHPTWTWYRRGEQILNGQNSTFVIISYDYWDRSQSWLQITPCLFTEHFVYDEYVCKATNIKGTNEDKVSFQRSSVPGQPTLQSYSVTQSTILLNVGPPINTGGMPTMAYELNYRAFGGPEGCIVGKGTPYSFSVHTLPSTRPGPVEVVHSTTGIYPYGHIINWIPPVSGGSPILGYRIRVRTVEADLTSITTEENIIPTSRWKAYTPFFNNPYLNYYHLAPLKPDHTYQLIVEAYNRHGYSLDGVDIERYSYLNRTPTSKPQLQQIFPGGRLNYRNSERFSSATNFPMKLRQSDLVPTWFLFVTPPGDELGPPSLLFGIASSAHASYWNVLFLDALTLIICSLQ